MSNKEYCEGLEFSPQIGWTVIRDEVLDEIFAFCDDYKSFLTRCKTERECTEELIKVSESYGFKDMRLIMEANNSLKPGDKIYFNNKDKSLALGIIGKKPLEKGMRIVCAHLDTPRLDLKPHPLYEDTDLAFFKTHYYGGVKKYQWLSIPLALHGVIVKKDGTKIKVVIGEEKSDPVLYITDLLPHLAKEQMEKKMADAISAESMNVLIGSIPIRAEVKEKVKSNVLSIINRKYGVTESDLISAELQMVPAFEARDVGLDFSLVGGYGQDDRVCVYTAFRALLEVKEPEYTSIVLLTDKEEIGSVGNTGAQSMFFENFVAELLAMSYGGYNDLLLRRCLANSKLISADVTAAYDPNYPEVSEKKNVPYLGKGIVITKYTGVRGKSGASDANPEFISEIINIFEKNNIIWQPGLMGKVDLGGGGTVAQFLAYYGMEVLDCGPCLLSIHSPFEIVSKFDVFMAKKAYESFMK